MNPIRASLLLALVFAFSCLSARAQNAFDDNFKVQLLPVTPEIEAFAAKVLKDYAPQQTKIVGEINKNGIYTLSGNLFGNGKLYSVVDDDHDVVVCELQSSAWKPLYAINVTTMWNYPAGYPHEQDSRGADDQPQPFWIINFENRPILVIASIVDKEGQYYYSILFDSKCEKILSTVTSFGQKPIVKNGYFISGDSSRVKTSWAATYFSKIKDDKFVLMKSWEDSQPWHSEDTEGRPDDTSNYASSDGKGYLILPDNRGVKPPADFLVLRCDPSEKRPELYPPADKPFEAIYFDPRHDADNSDIGDETLGYLFHKLTGLPMNLYPDYERLDMDKKPLPHWKIKVTGTDKVIAKLIAP
jgi:hypothetical protein